MRVFWGAATLSGFLLTSPARAAHEVSTQYTMMIDSQDSVSIRDLYKTLIDKENHHDLHAVSDLLWDSPSTLFVAKTATQAEDGWAGFWSKDTVALHFGKLFKGAFRIDPDYASEKIVALSKDVAQTYVPVQITVGYAGQTPVPKPFLMILEWVRTPDGWRMATDIALPIPPAAKP
jgi:hypothetical protein